jgi:hypothetical protein
MDAPIRLLPCGTLALARRSPTGVAPFRKTQEQLMRKTLLVLSAAAVVAATLPATARDRTVMRAQDHYAAVPRERIVVRPAPQGYYPPATAAATTTGVVAGTATGVALSQGAIGGTVGAALPATAAGAAAVGGVAGIGAGALVHAAVTPCQGFHALFGNFLTSGEGCANGQWVGYQPRRVIR